MVKVQGHRLKQDETTATAMASAVHTVNAYTSGGLWRMRLNYDRNALIKYR